MYLWGFPSLSKVALTSLALLHLNGFQPFTLPVDALQMCSSFSVSLLKCFLELRAELQMHLAWAGQDLLLLMQAKIAFAFWQPHHTSASHWFASNWKSTAFFFFLPEHVLLLSHSVFVWQIFLEPCIESYICLPKSSFCTFRPCPSLLRLFGIPSRSSSCPSGFGSTANLICMLSRASSKSLIKMLTRTGPMI